MSFPGTTQLQLAFTGGLKSIAANFSLDQPYLQNANNVVYNQYGQLDKRTGLSYLTRSIMGGGNIADGVAITTFNNELIIMDGQNLYTYDAQNNVWINRSSLFSTINNQKRILNNKISTQTNPDATSLNNLSLYLWEDNRPHPLTAAGVRYSVQDNATDAWIVADSLVYSNAVRPKVIANTQANQFNIYYQSASDVLSLQTVLTSRPQILTNQKLIITDGRPAIVDGYTNFAYDVTYAPVAPLISGYSALPTGPLIAYCGFNGLTVLDNNGTQYVVSSFVTTAACIAICTSPISGTTWIAYVTADNNPPFGLLVKNLTTGVVTQIASVDQNDIANVAIIEDLTAGNLNITYEMNNPTGNYTVNCVLTYKNTIINSQTQRQVGLASKPFVINDNIFINTIHATNLQATYFTQCLTQDFAIISKHSPSNGGTLRNNTLLAQCDTIFPDTFMFAGQRKGPFTSYENAQTVNLGVAGYTIDFSNVNAFNNVQCNNNLHIVGGIKNIYDGISCVEDNFHLFPELPDGYACDVQLQAGGNLTYNALTQPNQYQWTVVYEWTDNYQQVQRSGVGVANTAVTTTTGQGALITVPTLPLTAKINPRSPISIAIYRTQDSLPIFYKITDDNNPLINDTTVDTLTYVDNLSDKDIAANENLYTGSQLSNIAPPSCSIISLYQNRLFINQTEDQDVLWYSQNKFDQSQYNTLALDWNTYFIEGITSQLGAVTAISLLDQSLIIFKESSIFVLQGDGPNALFTAGQFNDATLQFTDTGCNNANSLVFITQNPNNPGGVLFKSAKGIYLYGQDNNLYYVGDAVQQYNDLTITSANVLANTNTVIFTTLEGTCLVYNYFFNTWTTWTSLPAVDATIWKGALTILTPRGDIMVQDLTDTIFTDTFDSATAYPVQMKVTLPWIRFNGAQNQQGYQCIYNCMLLGQLQGPHVLQTEIAYDYNPSILQTVLINSNIASVNMWGSLPIWGQQGGMWGNNIFSNYQFQINFKKFRCQAVQLTFTDLDPNPSAGFTLNGLSFEVLPLPGGMRLPTSNKVG